MQVQPTKIDYSNVIPSDAITSCKITRYILEEWHETLFNHIDNENTLDAYKRQGGKFVDFLLANNGFTKHSIENYLKHLKKEMLTNIKRSTAAARSNAAKVIVQRVCHQRPNLIDDATCKRLVSYVKWIRPSKGNIRNPIPKGMVLLIKKFLDSIEDADKRRMLKAQFALMALHGFRASEVCRLRIKDFSFLNNSVKVLRKGGDAETVKLFLRASGLIKQYIKGNGVKDFLFPQDDGHITRECLTMRWKRLFKKIHPELSEFSPHSFRHYLATEAAIETGDVLAIMQILGHKTTAAGAYYIGQKKKQQVHEQLEEIFTFLQD